MVSPQGTAVAFADGTRMLNMCANNYLGLAADPDLDSILRRYIADYLS